MNRHISSPPVMKIWCSHGYYLSARQGKRPKQSLVVSVTPWLNVVWAIRHEPPSVPPPRGRTYGKKTCIRERMQGYPKSLSDAVAS